MTWAGTFGKVLTWADMPWPRSLTKLPIILKGIYHPDDAAPGDRRRRRRDALLNHGGRQANGAGSPRSITAAVGGRGGRQDPVLFDSGVRSGGDVAKALALGATAVKRRPPLCTAWRWAARRRCPRPEVVAGRRPTCWWRSTAFPISPPCAPPARCV